MSFVKAHALDINMCILVYMITATFMQVTECLVFDFPNMRHM